MNNEELVTIIQNLFEQQNKELANIKGTQSKHTRQLQQLKKGQKKLETGQEHLKKEVSDLKEGQLRLEKGLESNTEMVTDYVSFNENKIERLEKHAGLSPIV